MRHFRVSFLVTILLMAVAGWWGYSHGGVPGLLQALWITGVLGVMEVSLSFDNAVVNASVLRHWNEFWQKLFLTVGILVAVFGMRLLFPLVIVSVATGEGLLAVWTMATTTPDIYAQHLTNNHAQVAAFGGAFLLLVFLNFLFDDEKELHWLGWAEEKVNALGTESLAVLITMGAVAACVAMGPTEQKYSVLASGIVGIAVYIGVNWISGLLEENEPDLQDEDGEETAVPAKSGNGDLIKSVARGSIGGFLYLEVLDASFSFDGAIGILALIMFASVKYHIPEWFTGLSGVTFILVSLWSSLRHRKQQAALA